MSSQISPLAVLYVCVSAATAHRWLVQGISLDTARSPHRPDCVQAWPALCPPPEPVADAAWLVASIAADNVYAADSDIAAAVRTAAPADQDALRAAFEATVIPFTMYRTGQYRRPEALVRDCIPADRLALIPSPADTGCADNERAYARQLHRLLRAMIGAPVAAPLGALVAAAVARGRATPFGAAHDNGRALRLYRVDAGPACFSYDSALDTLLAGETAHLVE